MLLIFKSCCLDGFLNELRSADENCYEKLGSTLRKFVSEKNFRYC